MFKVKCADINGDRVHAASYKTIEKAAQAAAAAMKSGAAWLAWIEDDTKRAAADLRAVRRIGGSHRKETIQRLAL